MSIGITIPSGQRHEQQQIEQHIAEFIARGGRIQQVERHASGVSLEVHRRSDGNLGWVKAGVAGVNR